MQMTDITDRLRRIYVASGANYVQEAADTIQQLRAELAECRSKPQELHLHANGDSTDCRTCDRYAHYRGGHFCRLCTRAGVLVCINGSEYQPADPVRLYETGRE